MSSQSPYDTVEWLGLSLQVPRDWQIVRHGTSKDLGTLAFTDRYAERLNFTWRRLEREPEVERLLTDQLAREQASHPTYVLARKRIGKWYAYQVETGTSTWLRALRFETATSQLLEVWLSLRPANVRSTPVSTRLLDTIVAAGERVETAKLCAFDVAAEYPAALALRATKIEPASATFEFEEAEAVGRLPKRAKARVRRMGMADSWYGGNAVRLLARESSPVEFQKHEDRPEGSHVVTYAEGDTTKGMLRRWLGRSQRLRAILWHCTEENAVYHVATESYDSAPLYPEQFAVSCCKAHRVEAREP